MAVKDGFPPRLEADTARRQAGGVEADMPLAGLQQAAMAGGQIAEGEVGLAPAGGHFAGAVVVQVQPALVGPGIHQVAAPFGPAKAEEGALRPAEGGRFRHVFR